MSLGKTNALKESKYSDKRVEKSVALAVRFEGLTVPQAMKAADFLPSEAINPAFQMKVRRWMKKLKDKEKLKDAVVIVPPTVEFANRETPFSPLTVSTNSKTPRSKSTSSMGTATTRSKSTSSTGTATTQSKSTLSTGTATKTQKAKPKLLLPGMRRIRATAKQAQQMRVNKKKLSENKSAAHIKATLIYEEQKQMTNGMSAAEVVTIVNREYGTNINHRTVQRYVQKGKAGLPPVNSGPPPGRLADSTFNVILTAFESYVQINQPNGE